ncbi:MAG: glycosyltransferase [Parabacteroides gordonii]|nr:glycosyltransferase [Parabacteroides gordonii]
MKILHVISSLSANSGGPAVSTLLPVRYLNEQGEDIKILTFRPSPRETILSEEPYVFYLPAIGGWREHTGYSIYLKKALEADNSTDIYHIQGLWQYTSYIAASTARKRNKPYVITLRGMLYPQALEKPGIVKKLALSFYQRRQLQEAACVQVTCEEELEYYRKMGFTNPVTIIPNPVEFDPEVIISEANDVKRFGYLGRIHPRKHIERLIDCWQRLEEPGELLIMGDGESQYVNSLKEKVGKAGLKRVRFTGLVTGREKNSLLASLSCLVVPSDFENFGRIIPETLVQGTPVIASKGTPWQELETRRCGWWVDNDPETLTTTIREVSLLDKKALDEMGKNGHRLVLERYTVEAVSDQMLLCYKWLMGMAGKPDFVFTE